MIQTAWLGSCRRRRSHPTCLPAESQRLRIKRYPSSSLRGLIITAKTWQICRLCWSPLLHLHPSSQASQSPSPQYEARQHPRPHQLGYCVRRPDLSVSQRRNNALIPTAAKFIKTQAGMQFCPTGDCTNGPYFTLTYSRMDECTVDSNGIKTDFVKGAKNLNDDSALDWSTLTVANKDSSPFTSTTTFEAIVFLDPNGDSSKDAKLKLTATVYYQASTVTTAGQTLTIPKGAVKFSAAVSNWPFNDAANGLYLEMAIAGKAAPASAGAVGADLGTPTIAVDTKDAKNKIVTLGSNLFVDVPVGVVLDGANKQAVVDVPVGMSKLTWTFPSFTSTLAYDPVLRYTDPNATPEPTTTAPAPAPTPSTSAPATTTPAPSSATHMISAVTALLGAAGLAYAFF